MSFRPHPLLRNPHVQTILGAALRGRTSVPCRRERLETPDGDFLDLDWAPGPPSGPLVLVIHGLAGSSTSGFVQGTMGRMAGLGVRPVAMNFRGCSGEPNRTAVLYHSGKTDDLGHVVDRLLAEPGEDPLLIVGYSMGGNVLLKWLGEQGAAVPRRVRGALAMSVPYHLGACADNLERTPLSRLYRWVLVSRLKARIREVMARFPGLLDPAKVEGVRTFEDFDEHITSPLHGFAGAHDYWERCSSRSFLPRIRCRTLLVGALDDPFMPEPDLPRLAEIGNPCLRAEFPPHGGHLGFVGPGLGLWAEDRVRRFVVEALAGGASSPSGSGPGAPGPPERR